MIDSGMPPIFVRLIVTWYCEQHACVRWGSTLSPKFNVSNGVRQGGILSPLFFNLYMDRLSVTLSKTRVGCALGKIMVNHLAYYMLMIDKVQEVIKAKKVAKKIWETSRRQEDRDIYRQANKAAKKAVATNKALAMNELYEELETPEGERKIFRIAKARDKASKDFSHMKQIKNEHGVVLRDLYMIIGRWKGYFDKLLNEENPRFIFNDGVPNKGVTQGISRNEVKVAISRMKNGKATGMDGIPVEVWKCLGEEGIDMLWDLMKGIYEQEKIPTEWRDSVIIPIYKEKGDIQDCGNYRGIKLMSHTMKIWERIIDRRLREEQLLETNNLVSCQAEGRRMQYLPYGNLWKNIGKNRKNCTWYL